MYNPPSAELDNINSLDNENQIVKPPFFLGKSCKGRLGRLNFINAFMLQTLVSYGIIFGLFIVFGIIAGLVYLITGDLGDPSNNIVSMIGVILAGIIVIIVAIIFGFWSVRIMILRLHDMNASGWLSILAFIPLLNMFFYIALMSVKGTDGVNQYGKPTIQGNYAGLITLLVLMAAYIVQMIFSFVMLANMNY